jgi:hypothetical protein
METRHHLFVFTWGLVFLWLGAEGIGAQSTLPKGPVHLVPEQLSLWKNHNVYCRSRCVVDDIQAKTQHHYTVTSYHFGTHDLIIHAKSNHAEIVGYWNFALSTADYWMRGCDPYIVFFPKSGFELRFGSLDPYFNIFESARCIFYGCGFEHLSVQSELNLTTVTLSVYSSDLLATSTIYHVFRDNLLVARFKIGEMAARYDKNGRLNRTAGPPSYTFYETFDDYQTSHPFSFPTRVIFQDQPSNPKYYKFVHQILEAGPIDVSLKPLLSALTKSLPHRICARPHPVPISRLFRSRTLLAQATFILIILVLSGIFFLRKGKNRS